MRDEAIERKSALAEEIERVREVPLRLRRAVDRSEDTALHTRDRDCRQRQHGISSWDADQHGRSSVAGGEERRLHRLRSAGCFDRVVDSAAAGCRARPPRSPRRFPATRPQRSPRTSARRRASAAAASTATIGLRAGGDGRHQRRQADATAADDRDAIAHLRLRRCARPRRRPSTRRSRRAQRRRRGCRRRSGCTTARGRRRRRRTWRGRSSDRRARRRERAAECRP